MPLLLASPSPLAPHQALALPQAPRVALPQALRVALHLDSTLVPLPARQVPPQDSDNSMGVSEAGVPKAFNVVFSFCSALARLMQD